MKIEVVLGNIVQQPDVEALVNSANANLRFGSGVAGAIHSAAGPKLEEYCRQFSPLPIGQAVISPGFDLPNPWIIHVRAASYINDENPELWLDKATSAILKVASEQGITSLAMPAIGTGVYKFPHQLAAEIIVRRLLTHSSTSATLSLVRICLADTLLKSMFEEKLKSCS
jgi:O-acetyl-ADP-ribose deacetylase (regulator of RNase III)